MEWISVDDRLPDTQGQTCLLFMNKTGFITNDDFYIGYWDISRGIKGRWLCNAGDGGNCFYPGKEVTHWMFCIEPSKQP